MIRIATIALIFSISCAGGAAFAGAVAPSISGMAAQSMAADLSVVQVKGTSKSKSKSTPAPTATPAPAPKPVAPIPSLNNTDYDNVLGLGNYFFVK